MDLVELDRLEVLVVVDNETDSLSPPCVAVDPSTSVSDRAAKYTAEVSHLVLEVKSGQSECLDFRNICCAGHGLSVLLTAEVDGKTHTLLFDGGPSPSLFEHNANSLKLNLANIETVVLSHWHVDHSAALPKVAQMISEAKAAAAAATNVETTGQKEEGDSGQTTTAAAAAAAAAGGSPVVFDLHPRHPFRRGLLLRGEVIPLNKDPEPSEMELPGTKVEFHSSSHSVLDNCFFVSGFIPRLTSYETGNPNHATQWEEGGEFEVDEEIADERYVAAAVKGKGVVVFSACSHAGIVNVMRDVESRTCSPPYAVFGGFHLSPRDLATRIEPTVADITSMNPSLVVAGHCTGWRAKFALAAALKDKFMPSCVGSRFSFSAATPDP